MFEKETNNSSFCIDIVNSLNNSKVKSYANKTQTLFRKGITMKAFKNPIQSKNRFTQILAGLLLMTLVLGHAVQAEELLVSGPKDIANLCLKELSIQESPNLSGFLSTDDRQPLSLQSIRVTTLTCNIDITDCTLFRRTDGYDNLVIKGVPCIADPGQPQLPMKTITVKLPKNAQALGIEIESGSYREIQNTVNLACSSEPYIWMRQEEIPEHVKKKWERSTIDSITDDLDNYLPGIVATYESGKDNDATYVNVRVFPVQYVPKNNKVVLITDVKINIYYSASTPYAKVFTNPGRPDPAECVIICPNSLKEAAELLRDLHVEIENVSTSVVTTEDINNEYSPADDPPYTGYSGDNAGKDRIVGYDYDLAKKIISYLRDQEQHPNLKYVVLFGDGRLIPPSYYVNEWAASEWYSRSYYEDWIPTDFLYTSPDYDFAPNYRVGRLPVSDLDQAMSVVGKIERWHDTMSWDWFKQVSLAGGRPFNTMWYYGELGTVDLINRDLFNGMELNKYFYTDGTLDVAHVKPLLTTKKTGLFYHIDHGSGHKLWLDEESIGAADIMDSSSPRYPLFNSEAPVVVSVSCLNGAYDTDLTNFEDQPEFPNIPYPISFGESVVLSNAGGIAYIGGARLNYADWSIFYDEGRLLSHHYYMAQICGFIFESYHNGTSRIGDMTYDALKYFSTDNNMEYATNRETIFGFVLLGDPVLSVPVQQHGISCQKPHLVALEPDRISGEGIPGYKDLPSDQSRSICVVSDSDSPTTDVKSIYVWSNIVVSGESFNTLSPTHTFMPQGCGYYLIRSSTVDGKEGWLYLNVQYEFNPTSNILIIDGDYGMDYEKYYTDALDRLGQSYDIWEAGARDPIGTQELTQYLNGVIIWTIPFSCPDAEEKRAFESYLNNGGRLFISGQDIGWCLTYFGYEMDDFYQNYLHAQYVKDNSQTDGLIGTPNDPIGNGLTINIWGGDGANNQYYPDVIEAISPGIPIFSYDTGGEAALRVDTGTYKAVYFGFGFEGINSQTDRDTVMKKVLDWLLDRSPRGH